MTEREQDEQRDEAATQDDETPEEFAEEIENDPSRNPPDEGLDSLRGG